MKKFTDRQIKPPNWKLSQRSWITIPYLLLIVLIASTIFLYGYTRIAINLRKEAYDLYQTYLNVEHIINQDENLTSKKIEELFSLLPIEKEYLYVHNENTKDKRIHYQNENIKQFNQLSYHDELFNSILTKMLVHIDLGDVYNFYNDSYVDLRVFEHLDCAFVQIGKEVDSNSFKGEIVLFSNVSMEILNDFKHIFYQCLKLLMVFIAIILLNYYVNKKLYFKPLEDLKNHYLNSTKFNMKVYKSKKPAIKEIHETVDVVNGAILELQDGLKESKSFLDEMVHEIKNPAHNIKNELELIEDYVEDEEIKRGLESVKKETENISSLLSSIKIMYDIYYLGASAPDIWVNPVDIIEPIFEEYRTKRPDRIFNYNYCIHSNVRIWIDDGSLELIIRNLLDNAIKYSKNGSSIFVGIREQLNDNIVVLDVVNTDSSIEYSKIGKIFDKYYRTNWAKEQTVGAGIGLWSIKNITEIYDAAVSVQSSTNTTGFVITFKHVKHVEESSVN